MVWQCEQSTRLCDESVTPDGQHRTRERCLGCSAATLRPLPGPAPPPHSARPEHFGTSAGWSCRSRRAAAASAIQRAAPQSVPHSHYWPPAAETRDHLSATVHPVLYTPCTVQPLYSNTPHTTVSLSATPRPWRRTLRYVQWNIFHTTSEIFLFLFYGTFNPRLWMTWMYLCSDNHHHDIVSILFIIYFLKIFPQGKNIFAYFTILQLFRAGAGVLLMIKLKIFLMLPRLSFQNNSYQKSDHDIKS